VFLVCIFPFYSLADDRLQTRDFAFAIYAIYAVYA